MCRTLSALLLLVAMLTSGCINDSATSTNNTTPPKAHPWKRTANEVIMRVDDEPDRLNPLLATSGYARQVMEQIFQTMVNLDPYSLELTPQLAVARPKVEQITEGKFKGGLKYTFEIQPAAKWDDGIPVTAADYIFGLKAVMIPTLKTERLRPYLQIIKDVQVDPKNPKIFSVFTAEQTFSSEEIVDGAISVMPAHLYDEMGYLSGIPLSDFLDSRKIAKLAKENDDIKAFVRSFNSMKFSRDPQHISGSGPYKLVQWETGQKLILEKKKDWWGDALADKYPALTALPDRLIYKDVLEDAVLSSLVKSEEIDALADISPKDFLSLKENNRIEELYNFYTPENLALYFMYLNTKDPKISDKRVRKALAHTINIDEMIKTLLSGFGTRTATPVHPKSPYYNSDLPLIDYNLKKAKQLLTDAGWEDTNNDGTVDKMINGKRVELIIPIQIVGKSSRQKSMVLMLQDDAKQIGMGIEIVPLEFNELKGNTRSGKYTAAIAGRTIDPLNWNPIQSWHTAYDNRTGFGNAETDALIEKIMHTTDDKTRYQLYKELQAIIYDEEPEIYFFVPKGRVIIHKRFDTKPTVVHPGYVPNYFKLKK